MATNAAMLSNAKALNWTYGPECIECTYLIQVGPSVAALNHLPS